MKLIFKIDCFKKVRIQVNKNCFRQELNCFWRVKLNMTETLKKQHKLNSKSGMSILEVTISIGIMGIMALSFASMMTEYDD